MSEEITASIEEPIATSNENEGTNIPVPGSEPEIAREDFLRSSFLRGLQTSSPQEPEVQETEEGASSDNPEDAPEESQQETEAETEEKGKSPEVIKLPDGREITFEQLTEWEKGHMMQADYTKKTQAVAEERRALEAEKAEFAAYKEQATQALQLWAALERDPIGTLDYLREQYEAQGIYEPKTPEELKAEDEKRQVELEKARIAREKEEIELKKRQAEFEKYMNGLVEKYKDQGFDRDKVLAYCLEYNINDPEIAFKVMNHDALEAKINELNNKLKTASANAVNEYVRKKAAAATIPPPIGTVSGGGSPPIQNKSIETLRDAKLAALARLQNSE